MHAKKAATPQQSARYLLYADRALQKISLRRISVRPKKPRKPSASSRTKKPAAGGTTRSRTDAKGSRPAKAARAQATADRWWLAFGVVCVVGITALIGVPSYSRHAASDTAAALAPETVLREDVATSPTLATTTPAPRPSAPSAVTARATATAASNRSIEPARPRAAESARPSVAEPPKAVPAAPTPAAAAAPASPVENAAVTTIQGCLQAGDDTFWLKDTSGTDTPKSRSWKSGFLKKRPASIEMVDAGSGLRLSSYVGQRVAATGTMTDRRMRAHSLHTVAASCD